MVYQGSKARLIKDILPYIQNCIDDNKIKCYVESFVGGANVIQHVSCYHRIGYDINAELIELLRYMRNCPDLEQFPEHCPFEHYAEVREDRKKPRNERKFPTSYTAGIGYFASYGGRYFDGGYGRDKTGKRDLYAERLAYARKEAPRLDGIIFNSLSYNEISFEQAFVYCDPPYKGTKTYGNKDFEYEPFYEWLRKVSKSCFVLVSEYSMPDDFICIWSKERKVMQKSGRKLAETACEKLYTLKGGLYDKWFNNETWNKYFKEA